MSVEVEEDPMNIVKIAWVSVKKIFMFSCYIMSLE